MQERRVSTAAPPSGVMMPCSFEDALYLVNDGDLSRTICYVVDVVDIVDILDIFISSVLYNAAPRVFSCISTVLMHRQLLLSSR